MATNSITNDSKLRPYDRDEWVKLGKQFLMDSKMSSSALESAYIALRSTDPDIAALLKEEGERRRKQEAYRLNKALR